MDSLLGSVLTIAITFPVSFLLARGCLQGVMRIVTTPKAADDSDGALKL